MLICVHLISFSQYFSPRNVVHGTAGINNILMHEVIASRRYNMMYSDYLSSKAVDVADKNPLILDESTTLAEAARIMRREKVSSVLVGRDSHHVTGIITETDILYRVVAENTGPFKTTLKEVMSSPLVTVDEPTLAKDAITVMRKNGIRRLPVMKNYEVIGILTLNSIIGNNHNESVVLADVELPRTVDSRVMCPYCQSRFLNKEELSKHIDRLYLGSGLLEGDARQW
jgi:signal-transduction protein with cAMP-binding, CBS, and nucleotidyltransferase domain